MLRKVALGHLLQLELLFHFEFEVGAEGESQFDIYRCQRTKLYMNRLNLVTFSMLNAKVRMLILW